MKKTNSNNYPSIIEAAGNGSHLYRWGIEEVTTIEQDNTYTSYNYFEVRIWSAPTKASITEAAIAALWPPSTEKKLINDYNAALKGILDESYIDSYTDFLTERKALKEQIALDITSLNL